MQENQRLTGGRIDTHSLWRVGELKKLKSLAHI